MVLSNTTTPVFRVFFVLINALNPLYEIVMFFFRPIVIQADTAL